MLNPRNDPPSSAEMVVVLLPPLLVVLETPSVTAVETSTPVVTL